MKLKQEWDRLRSPVLVNMLKLFGSLSVVLAALGEYVFTAVGVVIMSWFVLVAYKNDNRYRAEAPEVKP